MKKTNPHYHNKTLGRAALFSISCLASGVVSALPGGIAGFSGAVAGEDCTRAGCHAIETPPVEVPTVEITGPASVGAGATAAYSVTITGGPGVEAGLTAAASDGTLSVAPTATDVRVTRGEVVQAVPVSMAGGAATFMFDWMAPTVNGTYTLYVAGMSTDAGATLPVESSDGTTLATFDITVGDAANQPPIAVFTAPASAAEGVDVSFDASGSSDPDGTGITDYSWDFGDGTAGAGVTATHAFAAGTFTVQLTVTDDAGDTNTATADIMIIAAGQPVPPTANPGGPYVAPVDSPVTFDGSASTDPDGTIMTYSWTFSDGATGTGAVFTKPFAAPGDYSVALTVTDDAGLSAESTTTATIEPLASDPGAGEGLYVALCEACHGPGGVGGPDGDVLGESAQDILDAGVEYPVEMGFVLGLPEADVMAIADFLNPTADIAAGAELYVAMCESCHGPEGVGGPDGDVAGESAADILEAGVDYPVEMGFVLSLPEEDVMAMGAYLSSLSESDDEDEDADSVSTGGGTVPPAGGTQAGTGAAGSGQTSGNGATGTTTGGSQGGAPTRTSATAEKAAASGGSLSYWMLLAMAGIGGMVKRRQVENRQL